MMNEQLKPGDAIYDRQYGHGTLDRRSGAVCHPEGGGTENGWCATFNGWTVHVWPHTRGTLWDLADSHGPHNAGRVMVGLEEGRYPELTAAVDYWLARGSPYAPGYKLDRDHPAYATVKTDGTWSGVRWATPEEQAAYYEEKGGRGQGDKVAAAARPDPHLTDRDMLCESGCGVVPHRYRPFVEAGPYWRCSECGETTGSAHEMEPPAPHADCPGCTRDGERVGPHGAYMACEVPRHDHPSRDVRYELRERERAAVRNLLVEKAEMGLGPYPDDAVLADARSVLWGDHGKR